MAICFTPESLGFHCLHGFTPAVNVFQNCDNVDVTKDDQEINILMTETGGDARHFFKSISDILPMK